MASLGTAACPPYHLSIVIGGTSAEQNLKTVKLGSAKWFDELPEQGNKLGQGYRDTEWEERILQMSRDLGIGAQFGGWSFVSFSLPGHYVIFLFPFLPSPLSSSLLASI